ncbi:S24 family peptidase [Cypionkella sp.]|uniref:XRE family transcriptional regulator n=1 Tax=Cypionkella sp. TaxID=2811411 RepID=UPI002721D42E|nr:S24 family peptidase [Cypionkella sp.]MDO8986071.1 S24 family peptidase [Cypionkella sp.]
MSKNIMDSGDIIAANLTRLIAEKDTNNRAVADSAGLNPTGVRDIITRKVKNPTFATLIKIAEVLGVSIEDVIGGSARSLTRHMIAVAGRVGAGALVPLMDSYAKGDGLFHVVCPPQLNPHGIVAVQVEGDSMSPMYQPGHVLFYSRATHEGILSEDVGLPCVVEDQNGMAWVKQVKRGTEPGLFHLISLNPNSESAWDQRIRWASRVLLALPENMAGIE